MANTSFRSSEPIRRWTEEDENRLKEARRTVAEIELQRSTWRDPVYKFFHERARSHCDSQLLADLVIKPDNAQFLRDLLQPFDDRCAAEADGPGPVLNEMLSELREDLRLFRNVVESMPFTAEPSSVMMTRIRRLAELVGEDS